MPATCQWRDATPRPGVPAARAAGLVLGEPGGPAAPGSAPAPALIARRDDSERKSPARRLGADPGSVSLRWGQWPAGEARAAAAGQPGASAGLGTWQLEPASSKSPWRSQSALGLTARPGSDTGRPPSDTPRASLSERHRPVLTPSKPRSLSLSLNLHWPGHEPVHASVRPCSAR